MLEQVVRGMKEAWNQPRFCRARVHVAGVRTGVNVSYLPDGLEITGFHDRLPPYFRLESGQVFRTPGYNHTVTEKEAPYYNVFYTWDPRRIVETGLQEEEPLDDYDLSWRAAYSVWKFNPHLADETLKLLDSIGETLREIQYVVDASPEGRAARIRQLSTWDLSPNPQLVTLYFVYADGK